MWTINIYIKFAIIIIGIVGGIIGGFFLGFGYTWIFILIGIIFLVSYILLGTVQSAAELVQTMQFDAAEERLSLTKFPNLLYVTNRAFYYILKGSLAAQKKNNALAEDYFNTALSLKLPSDNERAMVLAQMASIQANKGNWAGAKKYYYQTKGLKVTENAIKEQIKQLDTAIQQSGQMKLAQSMGVKTNQMPLKPGGKRRRPPMR
ncbi:MAG: hypothetical protein H6567_07995 [Lewinellaceae bacterium]|nr:hypothetical protein [Lewinellaceae bacterium]